MTTRISSLRNLVALAAFLSTSFGCGGSPYIQVLTTSVRPVSKILAVGSNGAISIYNLPITATSSPVATIPETTVYGIAFDNTGRLFVDVGGQIQVFDQPISNGAAPAFVIPAPSGSGPLFGGGLAFDNSGNLFIGGGLDVIKGCHWYCAYNASLSVLKAPISGSSVISYSFVENNGPLSLVSSAAFDRNGTLWAVLDDGVLDETVPPFNGNSQTQLALSTPYTIPLGVAFDSAGNMYVSTGRAPGSGIQGNVVAFYPPFTASSQPTILFSSTTFDYGNGIALDSSGNMYAGTSSGLFMFSPPFTATGSPVVTLPGSFGDLAIGP